MGGLGSMVDTGEEEPQPKAGTASARDTAAGKKRRVRISLATLVALMTLATGALTLKGQLFHGDNKAGSGSIQANSAGEIPRFEGISGHLAESRALLDFFSQYNNRTVYLSVGFPKLSPAGPVSGANVITATVPYKDGNRTLIKEIDLMTSCQSSLPTTEENPTVEDGCMGTSLDIQGAETEDSYTFFQHGVPVIKGYFRVDVTGGLQNGLSPIFLKPLTFQQATQL
jgi:hypothetical protein